MSKKKIMDDDMLLQSRRETAIREARRLYPEINPVLAGWCFDYVESIGEKEMLERIRTGWYDREKSPPQNKE